MSGELSNAESLGTLLSQLGDPVGPQRLLDLSGGQITLAFATRLLRARGEAVWPVRSDPRRLAQLRTPTLLQLASDELVVLDSLHAETAFIRRGTGGLESRTVSELALEVKLALARAPRVELGRSFLRALLGVVAQCRGALGRLIALQLGAVGLGILVPWLTHLAVGAAAHDPAPSLLETVVAALVLSTLLRALLGWLSARTRIALEVQLVHAARHSVFQRILALPYAEHQNRGLGGLLQALGSSEASARLTQSIGFEPLLDAGFALAYLLVLAVSAPWLAVVLGGALALSAIAAALLARHIALIQTREIEDGARARARLHELIQGIATLKAGRAEHHGLTHWLAALIGERSFGLARALNEAWLGLWLTTLQRAGSTLVIVWAATEVLSGALQVADLVYLGMLSAGLLYSGTALCRALLPALALRPHLARVDALLGCKPVPAALPVAVTPRSDGLAIEFDDVWFRYAPDQPWILKGYSLRVAVGEHLELRGVSGQGKTTLLRLIAGLYEPERGTVAVYGREPSQARERIGYVPQHAQMFMGSLRENLELLSGAPLLRIQAACRKTGLDRWLESLPMGLETRVAPGGSNFSGGQRQWVVLTAAVASERPLLLLDEAMSQMDRGARAALLRARLFEDRTLVSVTHDD